MLNKLAFLLYLPAILFFAVPLYAEPVHVVVFPIEITQGEPIMVQIVGKKISEVKRVTFLGKELGVFSYQDKPTVLAAIDLNKKPGDYIMTVYFSDNSTTSISVVVKEREKVVTPFGIPEKLGGNSTTSQNKLVSTLFAENKTLENIQTGKKAFWTSNFTLPLDKIFVTDTYGYSRQTGAYTIPHKGVDFRAAVGTPVQVINRGVVRIVKNYRNYGKIVVVDHGLGVMSFYLHLSKINVTEGHLVQKGEVIGLSGQTGYVDAPHLHLSIRINNISVDPLKFFELFNK